MSAGNTYWLKGKNSLMSSHTLAGLVPLVQVFLLVYAANVIRFMNYSSSYLVAISRYPALSVCPADTHFECANKKNNSKKKW